MKNLSFLALIILFFSSCLEKTDPKMLTNTKWELVALPGLTLPENAKATLLFADSLKVSGKAFCNNYGGKAEIIDGKITLKNLYSTKMFCQETASAESAYMKAINQVNGAKVENNQLLLTDGDKKLMVFKKMKE